MTPQESAMLNELLAKVQQTRVPDKDPDAAATIDQALGPDPNAMYVLTQAVLVQQVALSQAKAHLDQLRQQVLDQQQQIAELEEHAAKHPGSFLGSLLGYAEAPRAAQALRTPPAPPSYPPQTYPPQTYPAQTYPAAAYPAATYPPATYRTPPVPAPSYPPVAPYASAPAPVYSQSPASGAGTSPSFLRAAASNTAGVATGALAFEGVETLLHSLGQGGRYGGVPFGVADLGGYGDAAPKADPIVHSYYDDGPVRLTAKSHFEAAYDARADSFRRSSVGSERMREAQMAADRAAAAEGRQSIMDEDSSNMGAPDEVEPVSGYTGEDFSMV